MLEVLATDGLTVKQIAARMGESQTKLYRHVALLLERGFVEVVSTRKVSGISEKTYRAISQCLVEDRPIPKTQKKQAEAAIEEGLASLFEQTRADIRRAIESGRIDVSGKDDTSGSLIALRGFMRATPGQAQEFAGRIQKTIKEFESENEDPGEAGERYSFTLAFHPAPEVADAPPKTRRKGSTQ
jgi:DNA-binding transcriptional ArsR family regulator